MVLAGFSCCAVAIAAVGVFGVLSYSGAQRSREIGVRTALGARPSDIVRLVLRQAAIVAAGGIGVGLWAAFALSKALATVLYGVNPHDGATFLVVACTLALVAALACLLPARRAARVDPLHAMRSRIRRLNATALVIGSRKALCSNFRRTAICADFGAFRSPASSEPSVTNQIRA